ncbi:MAG: glutathione S-transferase family protein [Paracoccaceae bacterium]
MYKVLGIAQSRTFRVLWMLEELGECYEHISAKPGSSEIIKFNGSGKVPVLLDGKDVLTDSSAIVSYLGDKHKKLSFQSGSIERAYQDSMVFRIIDEVDMILWLAARHSFILPEERRVNAIKPSLKWEFERNIDRIMSEKESKFLMGDEFMLPDIILAHCGSWARSAKFPLENRRFNDYINLCYDRPAVRRLTKSIS